MTGPERLLLQQRAAALARPLSVDDGAERLWLLGFRVADRGYAVEAAHVREVVAAPHVSHLPWAPPTVVGVTNVRGEIVPVSDVALVLGLAPTRPDGPVVIVDGGGRTVGLRVDAVDDMSSIRAADLRAPEGAAAAAAGDVVLGYTATAVVLDARVLSTDIRRKPPQPETP